ncbi:SCO2525 family SAM-dependent methyltransferase [Dactylosporangium sp. CA-092794]|uniref:SCO2525 family SAM-dependent methyltransferase n=1 Tax=Dactylosporangium sp. CA-092794 TaxID=3239929 RepID=UPI003D909074
MLAVAGATNADYPWDTFDSEWYLHHNYLSMHPDDRVVITRVADFFGSRVNGRRLRGVDVGAGTNLYPAMAMLPLTSSITFWEYSAANVRWLQHGVRPSTELRLWEQYWDVLSGASPVYRTMRRPRARLFEQSIVTHGNIFDLPEAEWDVGTMFFVAESITAVPAEFERALLSFIRSLKPDAPFAAAFIRNSPGYTVGDQQFPAVAITEHEVRAVLRTIVEDLSIEPIACGEAFRDGWDGMVLATGVRGRRRF